MTIHFQHLRETKNIGDLWCSPFDYFDWPDAEVSDLRQTSSHYDVGIYGGGKIFGGLKTYKGVNNDPRSLHIAWGVGTRQSFFLSRRYAWARGLCDLVGSRDYGSRQYDFAPCASCMSSLFDEVPPPEHDVVFYNHGGKTDKQGIQIPSEMPNLDNNCASFEEAIRFIASGRTVVSNSYHGVYWGLLLGRKVICIPFSNKFNAYRRPPAYASAKNWLGRLDQGKAHGDMLELCREATIQFRGKVLRSIEIHKAG